MSWSEWVFFGGAKGIQLGQVINLETLHVGRSKRREGKYLPKPTHNTSNKHELNTQQRFV